MYNLIGYIQYAHLIDKDITMDQHEKDIKFANIMTAMERHYKIPMFRDTEWEKHNQDVLKAYKFVSSLRST